MFGYKIVKEEKTETPDGVYTMEDFKKDKLRKERLEKVKAAAKDAAKFVEDHGAAIGSALAGTAYGVHKLNKYLGERDDNFKRDRTIYDPSKKQRLTLRRKMRRKEMYEYIERRDRGEKVYDILKDMGLLK